MNGESKMERSVHFKMSWQFKKDILKHFTKIKSCLYYFPRKVEVGAENR